ncbi:hypothetical protein VTI74DRAFT_8127 [Chaetomium olivicolor]
MGPIHYGAGGSPSPAFVYPPTVATTPLQTNQTIPPTASPPGPHSSSERESHQAAHPYPMAARRILTPRSPRTASLSRAALRSVEAQHLRANLSSPTPRGAVLVHDQQIYGSGLPPLGASAQLYGPGPREGPTASSPTWPTSGLSRSLSQPSLSHVLPSAPPLEPLQPAGIKREHGGRPVLSGPPFANTLPQTRPFGASGVAGDTIWGPGPLGPLHAAAARSLQTMEGQPILTITPRHGEEIIVPVDVHQGSKQSDQKRQRNAGASARFRQRKRERERVQQEELLKLGDENRELEKKNEELAKRCEELETQRDFYRNERNHLRDIVLRTPSIREWAERRPPSPVFRSGAVFTSDNTSLLAHPPPPLPPSHPHSHSQSHPAPRIQPLAHPLTQQPPRSSSYAEPSTLEPPARRRRTDSEPQLPTSSYSLMPPTTLPPIAGPSHGPPAFGIPPSPHVTPPPGVAQLPPLRFDHSRTPSTTPPPVPTGPPPPVLPPPRTTSPYATSQKLPHETGWATEPREQPDGRPR